MAQVKRTNRTAQEAAATKSRSFRTFLLMAQFEAREIGARITQARREKGLSQEELSEMASFSKRSLQDYEAGLTIPYRHFREIGRLLSKPPEWFLYGESDSPEEDTVRAAVREEIGAALADVTKAIARVEERLEALEPQADAQGKA